MTEPLTIMGIDPGYDRLGWCIARLDRGQLELVEFGCIETTGMSDIMARFKKLDQQLSEILEKFQPTQAAIETLFFSSNKTTAMRVSEARGVILSCLFRQEIEIREFNPMTMKLTVTGNGQANKTAIAKMLRLQFHLGNDKILDDALDAIGMAITLAAHQGQLSKSPL